MKFKNTLLIFIFTIFFLSCRILWSQIIYNGIGHIPQSWQVDWTKAGLLVNTPKSVGNLFNVVTYGAQPDNQQNDDTNAINSAIEAAKNTGNTAIVYFLPEHYKITSTIDLSRMSLQDNKIT